MPLRDHFRPPVSIQVDWQGVHAMWPTMMILRLNRTLPDGYRAEPRVQLGSEFEIDVGTLEREESEVGANSSGSTAVLTPPRPTLSLEADLPAQDEFELRIHDSERLVAAVEVVSPRNKDRPDSREAFVSKCAALLRKGVSVSIVDIVTSRRANLYAELLDRIGHADPMLGSEPSPLYAVTCRTRRGLKQSWLDNWAHVLAVGQPLPTLPVWLSDESFVNLELEASYEDTCRELRLT